MANFLVNMMRSSEFDDTGKVCSILQIRIKNCVNFLTLELCFDGMAHGYRSSAPEAKLVAKCQQQNSQF